MPFHFRAFPCGLRYLPYLFCLIRTKKDAAAIDDIANTAFKISFTKKVTYELQILMMALTKEIPLYQDGMIRVI